MSIKKSRKIKSTRLFILTKEEFKKALTIYAFHPLFLLSQLLILHPYLYKYLLLELDYSYIDKLSFKYPVNLKIVVPYVNKKIKIHGYIDLTSNKDFEPKIVYQNFIIKDHTYFTLHAYQGVGKILPKSINKLLTFIKED